jgi:hypothetical protein
VLPGCRQDDVVVQLGVRRAVSRFDNGVRVIERVAVGAESFEIVVRGRLSPTLVAALDGFEVIRCDDGLTHLVGFVPDQSRLHGLLELLRDLNIELVSMNPVLASETRSSTPSPKGSSRD